MLLRRFTDYILQNRHRTMAIVFGMAFLPLIGSFSILIAAFITLRKGAQEGFCILIAAVSPLLIELMISPATGVGGIHTADIVMLMIANNVMTWFLAVLLRRYASWSLLLQLAALFCLVVIVGLHLIYPDMKTWWQTNLSNYFLNTVQAANQLSPEELHSQKAAIVRMAEAVSPYATGFITISVVYYALLQVLLARWWQAYMYNPGGLRKELYDIRLSYVAGIVFLIGMGLSLTGNEIFLDTVSVLCLTFAFAGLSILHKVITLSKASWFWIGLIYLGIMFYPELLLLVAVVGVMDTFFDIRKQLRKRRSI